MTDPLRRVLVKRPDEAFAVDDPARWNYAGRPNLDEARREHDTLVEILSGAGAEVIEHPEPQPGRADAIFVFDPVLVTDRGAVILRMGKELRRGEEAAIEVPAEEFPTMAPNVLALTLGKCLMLEGNRHAAASGAGGVRGPHLPRPGDLAQGRGRSHLPHAAHLASVRAPPFCHPGGGRS